MDNAALEPFEEYARRYYRKILNMYMDIDCLCMKGIMPDVVVNGITRCKF